MNAFDLEGRRATFAWLEEQIEIHGEALPYSVLKDGFLFDGNRIYLVGPQGIFKPASFTLPISISSTIKSPYNDVLGSDGVLRYSYRGDNTMHRENVGVRECWRKQVPLVYLHAISVGRYVPLWPAFVAGDSPADLTFLVRIDDSIALKNATQLPLGSAVSSTDADIRRGYITVQAKRRIHQQAFRTRVITAYRQQCALCRLKHEVLLDAAHIVPDSDVDGVPAVSNGLALCKIHHAAFDKHFLTVRPDYQIEIRADVLKETDGPMLKHGLQGLHKQQIVVPRDPAKQPNRESLDRRYQRFVELARE